MSKFVSYNESIVNLDRVSLISCDDGYIHFYCIQMADLLESWHFKDEETALEAWELLKTKLGTINVEPL
jgi:hypothetical protein